MLTDDVDAATPAELRRHYEEALRGIVETVGEERVRASPSVDRTTVEALLDDTDADVPLVDAAGIVAIDDDQRSAEDVLAEIRDVLLFGMTSAVLDVDTLAADVDGLDPNEVHAMVEGRHPMTLDEYARLRHRIEHA